jgi:hypothetical protein
MIERSEIKANKSSQPILDRCLYCGHSAELIWVHGHGQCSNCGINTEECCRGENCAFDQNQ